MLSKGEIKVLNVLRELIIHGKQVTRDTLEAEIVKQIGHATLTVSHYRKLARILGYVDIEQQQPITKEAMLLLKETDTGEIKENCLDIEKQVKEGKTSDGAIIHVMGRGVQKILLWREMCKMYNINLEKEAKK